MDCWEFSGNPFPIRDKGMRFAHPFCPYKIYRDDPACTYLFRELWLQWITGAGYQVYADLQDLMFEVVTLSENVDKLEYFETWSKMWGGKGGDKPGSKNNPQRIRGDIQGSQESPGVD
jgi:hypothetical protein